nr:hypothetical protein [Plectonema radiosum]
MVKPLLVVVEIRQSRFGDAIPFRRQIVYRSKQDKSTSQIQPWSIKSSNS